MFISRNPGVALELAFTHNKRQHGSQDPTKEIDYTPSHGTRFRITRNKEGAIKSIPWVRHDVKSSKPGRKETTGRVADAMFVGKVLAAALNQAPERVLLLRFIYDPEFMSEQKYRRDRQLIRQWAHAEMCNRMSPSVGVIRRRNMGGVIWEIMLDFSQRVRSGDERYSDLQYCNYLGFANKKVAHWDRDYKDLIGDVLVWLQDLENEAIQPILAVIDHELADDEDEKPERPAKPLKMRFTETLSKRPLTVG